MFGSMTSAGELGIIPCAISWLYKGIAEHRDKFGSRFSVRMSALAVNATKATAKAHDLLASMASGELSRRIKTVDGIVKLTVCLTRAWRRHF